MAKFSRNNRVKLIHSGKEYFELIRKLIDAASHSIHLQTYIFNADETGTAVAEALINAAKRKVSVYVLVDGYASQDLPAPFIKKMRDAGIFFRFFEPLFSGRHVYFGRRLHHKVAVIDGIHALVGGLNIADRYNDVSGQRAWFDLALYTQGEASIKLYTICSGLWSKKFARHFAVDNDMHQKVKQVDGHHSVRVCRNDWVNRKHEVFRSYMDLFRKANQRITIMCSYFLPGTAFRKQLKRAVKRGVKIKVILAGLSDIQTAKYAERYLYRWMVRNKIEVYEYQPAILHAKMAVADGQLMTLGSFNINNISTYASVELNLDVQNEAFAKKVQDELDNIISKDCIAINEETYKINLFSIKQFLQWGAFQFIRLVLTLSTFYFRQKE